MKWITLCLSNEELGKLIYEEYVYPFLKVDDEAIVDTIDLDEDGVRVTFDIISRKEDVTETQQDPDYY